MTSGRHSLSFTFPVPALPREEPRNLILFGAGASYGSDVTASKRKLPPLGMGLYPALQRHRQTQSWRDIPPAVASVFLANGFEHGMRLLLNDKDLAAGQMRRDWEMARYFSQFRPGELNVYHRIARALRKALADGWNGALITLNYERLLELALLRAAVFPVVAGVQFYDGTLPAIPRTQLLEVAYPHGACHLILGINPFDLSLGGNVVLGTIEGSNGVNQLLIHEHIGKALDGQYLVLICRYEPAKSPSFGHGFFDTQRTRCAALAAEAQTIMIVGAYCAHETDQHVWEPIAKSPAEIVYLDPNDQSIQVFQAWAESTGRSVGNGYRVVKAGVWDGIDSILRELQTQREPKPAHLLGKLSPRR